MKLVDTLFWIRRALWMQRVRSLLTVIGFAIGIAAVVLLGSLGEGLRTFVLEEFSQFGSHIIAVTPGKTETLGVSGILDTTRPLTLEDADALARLPGVEQVVPVVMGTGRVESHARARYTSIAGVGPSAARAWGLEVASGTFLPPEGFHQTRAFAVLGSQLRDEIFGATNPLGRFVHVGGSRFRVMGVMAPKGEFLGMDLDDMVYIPAVNALQMFNRESLMEVDVYYSAATPTEVMTRRVRELLVRRHGYEDFTIVTQDEMLATMDNILRILKYAGVGLGAVSLLVGAVGITTILTISVTERIGEVGLLRALGGTRRQIRYLFLGEAAVLGLLGGVAGIVVVLVVVGLVQLAIPGLPLGVEPDIAVAALLIAMAIGLVAGLKPAMDATRLNPIDALRAE